MGYSGFGSPTQLIIVLLIMLPLFLLPSIVALARKHPHKWFIVATNIFGSFLFGAGWIVALIWCFILPAKVATIIAPHSVATELEKLHSLKEKGALSQEEFDAQKKTILNS